MLFRSVSQSRYHGRIATKLYDIKCRDPRTIFLEKRVKADQVEQSSYDDIINMIKASVGEEQTLLGALKLVATSRTVAFVENLLNEVKTRKESK